jgi:hypothetical protein
VVSAPQNQWLDRIVAQMRAMPGIRYETLKDGRIALEISYNGESRKLIVAGSASDYRAQKEQYSRIREELAQIGIKEDMAFVAPRRSRRPMSADMVAARAKRKKEFDAWKDVCRTLRRAEESLDIEFEIAQMRPYY